MLQVMSAEKWRLMREEILPAYEKILSKDQAISFRKNFDIIEEYYTKELYGPQIVKRLWKISQDAFD